MTNEEKFATLNAKLDKDPAALKAFLADPKAALNAAGIPLVQDWSEALDTGDPDPTSDESEQLRVKKHWWGQNFIMNEKLTQDIVDGTEGIGAVTELLTVLLAGVEVLAAGIAAAFVLKVVEIKIVDKGKGVYWPITWIQWGALLSSVPLGPAAVAGTAALFVHPLRTK